MENKVRRLERSNKKSIKYRIRNNIQNLLSRHNNTLKTHKSPNSQHLVNHNIDEESIKKYPSDVLLNSIYYIVYNAAYTAWLTFLFNYGCYSSHGAFRI